MDFFENRLTVRPEVLATVDLAIRPCHYVSLLVIMSLEGIFYIF